MKHILTIILALLPLTHLQAKDDITKLCLKALTATEPVEMSLDKEIQSLQDKADSLEKCIKEAKNRMLRFQKTDPTEVVGRKLAQYTSVREMAADRNFPGRYKDCELGMACERLRAICLTTDPNSGYYDKAQNSANIKELAKIKGTLAGVNLQTGFRTSLDRLAEVLSDYDFAVEEMARVMKLIDNNTNYTYDRLRQDNELVYIEPNGYLNARMKLYISNPNKRADIKKALGIVRK